MTDLTITTNTEQEIRDTASEDYRTMGLWVNQAARRNKGGCYGILEGGYNHSVLGENVLAFIDGLNNGL